MCCYDTSAADQWKSGQDGIKKKCCNNPSGSPVIRPRSDMGQRQMEKVIAFCCRILRHYIHSWSTFVCLPLFSSALNIMLHDIWKIQAVCQILTYLKLKPNGKIASFKWFPVLMKEYLGIKTSLCFQFNESLLCLIFGLYETFVPTLKIGTRLIEARIKTQEINAIILEIFI